MKRALLDFWFKWFAAPFWQLKRRLVFKASSGRCHYCREDILINTFTVDHVVPRAIGGTNAFSNLVACCKYCNKLKADSLISVELVQKMRMRAALRAKHNKKPEPAYDN